MSSKYKQFYDENCTSLNYKEFQQVKKIAIGHILDKACPAEMKMLFGDYFFRKISYNFTFQPKQKEEVVTALQKPITSIQTLITKASYLKYTELDALKQICEFFYYNRFPDKFFTLQMLNDAELVKLVVLDGNITHEELKNHFLIWIAKAPSLVQKSNLLDVLLRYYPNDDRVVKVRRELEYGSSSKTKSITNNAQNVHEESVFSSALKVAKNLVLWSRNKGGLTPPENTSFRTFSEWILESVKQIPSDEGIIQCVIEKMCIDTTSWTYEDVIFDIPGVFLALAHYIKDSEHKTSLKIVLMQELRVMAELCSSGYIARFASVISGFDEEFTIQLPLITQFQTRISHKIMKSLEGVSDAIIEDTLDPEKFLVYARAVIDLEELKEEFGEEFVEKELERVLKDICG